MKKKTLIQLSIYNFIQNWFLHTTYYAYAYNVELSYLKHLHVVIYKREAFTEQVTNSFIINSLHTCYTVQNN